MHYLITQQHVVDGCDVGGCEESVAVNVAFGEIGTAVIQDVVVEHCHVAARYPAVTIHV